MQKSIVLAIAFIWIALGGKCIPTSPIVVLRLESRNISLVFFTPIPLPIHTCRTYKGGTIEPKTSSSNLMRANLKQKILEKMVPLNDYFDANVWKHLGQSASLKY